MDVRFFKQDGKWYADVPGHTMEENEMVMGCEVALDALSEGHAEVILSLSEGISDDALLCFTMVEHDDAGGTYELSGFLLGKYMEDIFPLFLGFKPQVWICNVTHDVFGEHPKEFCIRGIKF